MDLEMLDRDELEARAAQAGVTDPQHKTRRQLISAISRASGRSAASRTLGAARTLFELAASVARGFRPTVPLRLAPRPIAPEARMTRPIRPALDPRPSDERTTVPLKPAALEPMPLEPVALDPAIVKGLAQERATVSLGPTLKSRSPDERITIPLKPQRAPDERITVRLKPQRTPAAAESEPIVTQTMARLLDAQGHHQRALRIYDELMRARPDDAALRREMDGARSRAKGRRAQAPKLEDADAESDEDAVVALHVDATTALISWDLDAQKLEVSRALLSSRSPLMARALIVFPSKGEFVSRELRSCAADREGHWVLSDLPPGAHTAVALGLELESGFHSLAHAAMLPPG